MAFPSVQNMTQKSWLQQVGEGIGLILGQAILKAPMSILAPLTNAIKTLATYIKKLPGLKDVDFIRLPIIGPILVSVQTALSARQLLDRAEHAMGDPVALAQGFATEANANAKAALDTLGRPPDMINVAADELRKAGEAAARVAAATGAAIPTSQGELLGHKVASPFDMPNQAELKKRLAPLGGVFALPDAGAKK
ncbi:hypothetical protein PG987_009829 [Apiospora arundinis]